MKFEQCNVALTQVRLGSPHVAKARTASQYRVVQVRAVQATRDLGARTFLRIAASALHPILPVQATAVTMTFAIWLLQLVAQRAAYVRCSACQTRASKLFDANAIASLQHP